MSAREDAAAAFQFLSRFPVKGGGDFSRDLLRRSVVYYPLVGAAIGGVLRCALLQRLGCCRLGLPL